MPSNTQEFKLDAAQAQQVLDDLIRKAEALETRLKSAAGALSPGANVPVGMQTDLQKLAATQGAISAARQSMEMGGGSGGAFTEIVRGGVSQGLAQYGQFGGYVTQAGQVGPAISQIQQFQFQPTFPKGDFAAGIVAAAAPTSYGQPGPFGTVSAQEAVNRKYQILSDTAKVQYETGQRSLQRMIDAAMLEDIDRSAVGPHVILGSATAKRQQYAWQSQQIAAESSAIMAANALQNQRTLQLPEPPVYGPSHPVLQQQYLRNYSQDQAMRASLGYQPQSYQTWMGGQPPMSMNTAYGLINASTQPTMAMPAPLGQTQMYSQTQMMSAQGYAGGQFVDWGAGMGGGMSLTRKAGMVMGAHALVGMAGDALNASARGMIQGRPDIAANYQAAGANIGGLLLGGAGFLLGGGNPFFAGMGLMTGEFLGSAVGNWFSAPEIQRFQMQHAISGVSGMLGQLDPSFSRDVYTGTGGERRVGTATGAFAWYIHLSGWAQQQRQAQLDKGVSASWAATEVEYGTTASSVFSSMIAGGTDPMQRFGRTATYGTAGAYTRDPLRPDLQPGFESAVRSGRLINTLAGAAGIAINRMPRRAGERQIETGEAPEMLFLRYTRLLGEKYGANMPEVQKELAPIFANAPETGDNIADILMRFGPESAFKYADLQVSAGTRVSRPPLEDMYRTSADVRNARRWSKMASYMPVGGPAAQVADYSFEMSSIASLDTGRQSEAYQEARYRRRNAIYAANQETDILNFGIPMTQAEGALARSNTSPFAPGNRYALEMNAMGIRSQQINTLVQRGRGLQREGELTPEMSLAMTQQIESLQTANARGIATLSEGVENRLPALSAGTPDAFRYFSTSSLAAYNMLRVNSPIRGYGAVTGKQARQQDEFANSWGMDTSPSSTTGLINDPQAINILRDIDATLKRMAGSGIPSLPDRGNAGLPPQGGRQEGGASIGFNY